MKKTSNSEPREKRTRTSNSGPRKSNNGVRTPRASGNESSGFESRSRTSEREEGASRNEFRSKSREPRSSRSQPWKSEESRQDKPRRSEGSPWKKEGETHSFTDKPRRSDGGPSDANKEFRDKKSSPWRPEKSANSRWKPESKSRKTDLKTRDADDDDTKVWDSDAREWVRAPSKIVEKRNSTGGKIVKGVWTTNGGSRTRNQRSRNPESGSEAPVKQSREYKKDFRKTNEEPSAAGTSSRAIPSGRQAPRSEPWKKDKPGNTGSGPWKTEGGSRTPYRRPRRSEEEPEAPVKQSRGYKKDIKPTRVGESRIFDSERAQTEKAPAKSADRTRKVTGDPWKTDVKPTRAKSKKRTVGKGPGNDAYSRPRKASNGPHKKKF